MEYKDQAAQGAQAMFDLDGDVAIVTGGAGVLPYTMARTLAAAGAKVALWGRGTNHPVTDAADRLAEECSVDRSRIAGITVDTADEEATQRALEETVDALGEPTILINGVGGNRGKSNFVDIDRDILQDVVMTNIFGGLIIPLQVCGRHWKKTGTKASVINMASMTSYKPLSGVWAYNAAKSAVKNLTEGAAREFAADGIRVNGIAPGFFIGHQNKDLLIADEAKGTLTDRGRQIIDRTPFKRFGNPEDLEGATLFLASRKASEFVTGVTIPVDGGFLVDNI